MFENNRICKLLNIKYPVFQGGMAWVSDCNLAAAVSNAGGLGLIAGANAPAEWVREQIKKTREMTDKTFGVNVMLLSPYVDEVMQVICEEKVQVITTGAGNPGKYVSMLKENGVKIIPVIPSVALAKKMEKDGADAVIAEGTESGGHIGELTTMALVPQVTDAVNIPVLAAGGIADSRGIVASFALGADGVQIGTRFLCSAECNIHRNYKDKVVAAKDRDAVVTGRSTGHPVRSVKNKLTREFDRLEKSPDVTQEDIDKLGVGAVRAAAVDGDVEMGSVLAGQIAGMITEILPVNEIMQKLINGITHVCEDIEKK